MCVVPDSKGVGKLKVTTLAYASGEASWPIENLTSVTGTLSNLEYLNIQIMTAWATSTSIRGNARQRLCEQRMTNHIATLSRPPLPTVTQPTSPTKPTFLFRLQYG